MSRGVNKAILIGSLGKDPELRSTTDGISVANVSIATSEIWKDKSGKKQEKTEWHRVVFFGRLAEIVGEYAKKGSKIYIEGKIQTNKWQGSDEIDRFSTEIVAHEMQLLNRRDENTEKTSTQKSEIQLPDEDIPF